MYKDTKKRYIVFDKGGKKDDGGSFSMNRVCSSIIKRFKVSNVPYRLGFYMFHLNPKQK